MSVAVLLSWRSGTGAPIREPFGVRVLDVERLVGPFDDVPAGAEYAAAWIEAVNAARPGLDYSVRVVELVDVDSPVCPMPQWLRGV
jgi:hypothetical protein